jgi:prefoldin subunit 4
MGDEKEVRKEDQDRINRFSRLHSKEKLVEEDLKTKQVMRKTCSAFRSPGGELTRAQKDKEDLEEISSELELADEDEKVPYVHSMSHLTRNVSD